MPPRILVVDDEPVICELIEELLVDAGYAVRHALDGKAALEAALADPPDLVISDLWMPRLDGAALHQELRAHGLTMPVLFVSAALRMQPPDGARLIRKPFDADDILAHVAELLPRRPPA